MILCRPDHDPPTAAILVIHSWWGLTQSFHTYGQALAKAGFLVGLSDLFDGRIATTEATARTLRARPRRIPMYRQFAADLARLDAEVAGPKGVVGFSMGGHWAVWLAQRPEYRIGAAILYYAARGGDFGHCRAPILAHFAQDDPWVSTTARRGMERAAKRAGLDYSAHDYPKTGHWFAESAQPAYSRDAAHLALSRDITHFRNHIAG
jgi:carboxymethylenebutenolidase